MDVTRGGLYSRITEMDRKLQACLAWHRMGDHGSTFSVRGSLHQLVPVWGRAIYHRLLLTLATELYMYQGAIRCRVRRAKYYKEGWCRRLRLPLSTRSLCLFPVKSAGGKFSSIDLNINIKGQLETIILAQWHTSLGQMRAVNLISWGCLRSGFQAQGRWAF